MLVHFSSNANSSSTAVTGFALAGGYRFLANLSSLKISVVELINSACRPRITATRWSSPDSSSIFFMDDKKSPFGFEILNIAVGHVDRTQWVDDSQPFVMKKQLWPHPKKVNQTGDDTGYAEVDYQVSSSWEKQDLNAKGDDECIADEGKDYIAHRSNFFGFVHSSIFADKGKEKHD